ncbi:MAG: hypothetical protein ABIK15_21615 [Pseudomonadota bacterium]
MKNRIFCFLSTLLLTGTVLIGCSSTTPLVIKRIDYQEPEVVRTRRYDPAKISSLLVIQPEKDLSFEKSKETAEGVQQTILASGKDEYVSYIEAILLKKGYTVISDDILAKQKDVEPYHLQAGERIIEKNVVLTQSELATKFGKESGADAILKINKLKAKQESIYYIYYIDDGKWEEIADRESWEKEKEHLYQNSIAYCLNEERLLEFVIDVEINDIETGNILAKGSAVLSTRNVMPDDYQAILKSDTCRKSEENFQIQKYTSLKSMDVQIKELINNIMTNLVDEK